MNAVVARHSLRNAWIGLLWYAVGNALLLVVVQAVAAGKQAAFEAAMGSFPTAMLDAFQINAESFSTPIGYISSTMLSLMWPFILIALVAGSAAAVTGMVEDGTIHFDLSLPVSRPIWLLSRIAASLVGLALFVATSVLALHLMTAAPWWRFGVLGFAFGFLALGFSYAVAVSTNGRGTVLSGVFGLFVFQWLLTTLSGASHWEWMGSLSVYSAYRPEAVMTGSLEWVYIALWTVLGAAFFAYALWRWRARDIPA